MRSFRIRVAGKSYLVEVDETSTSPLTVSVNGRPYTVEVEWQGAASEATVEPSVKPATPMDELGAVRPKPLAQAPKPQISESERAHTPVVEAPMPGVIVEVRVQPGATVARGDELCVLEAMKMRNSIRSPRDGRIAAVPVSAGNKVAYGDLLIRFDDAE
ncbi:MAG: biotin/lipoyl-containing protein [Caldilineales bacterium]